MKEAINIEKDQSKLSVILMDLGMVILYSKEELLGKMNPRHKELLEIEGKHYPFFAHFGVNDELLVFLAGLRGKYKIYMVTEGTIQNHQPLKEKLEVVFDFDNIISTGALGLDKKKPEAYEYVVGELGTDPSKILFIDDSLDNVVSASKVGFQTIQFTSEEQVIVDMKEKLRIED